MTPDDIRKHIQALLPAAEVDFSQYGDDDGFELIEIETKNPIGGMFLLNGAWNVYRMEYNPGGRDEPPGFDDATLGVHQNYWMALQMLIVGLEAVRIDKIITSFMEAGLCNR